VQDLIAKFQRVKRQVSVHVTEHGHGDATEIRTVVDEVSPVALPMGLLDIVRLSMSLPGRIRRARRWQIRETPNGLCR
jgi:hypothetical protein